MAWKNYGFRKNVGEDVARRADYTCKLTTQFLASENWADIISKSVFRHMTLRGLVDIYRRFGRGVSTQGTSYR